MGFFKLFKNKAIAVNDKELSGFITPVHIKGGKVEINQKLVVPNGHAAVIVCKDKPLQEFSAGEHELGLAYMPKITKILKLDKGKVVKRGNYSEKIFPKNFKADIYLVNNSAHAKQIVEVGGSTKLLERKGREYYNLSFTFSYLCLKPLETVKLFLIDWPIIKPRTAENKLNFLVTDLIKDCLMRAVNINQVMDRAKGEALKKHVVTFFAKYGIEINNFEVTQICSGSKRGESKVLYASGGVACCGERGNDNNEQKEDVQAEAAEAEREKELTAQEEEAEAQTTEHEESKTSLLLKSKTQPLPVLPPLEENGPPDVLQKKQAGSLQLCQNCGSILTDGVCPFCSWPKVRAQPMDEAVKAVLNENDTSLSANTPFIQCPECGKLHDRHTLLCTCGYVFGKKTKNN